MKANQPSIIKTMIKIVIYIFNLITINQRPNTIFKFINQLACIKYHKLIWLTHSFFLTFLYWYSLLSFTCFFLINRLISNNITFLWLLDVIINCFPLNPIMARIWEETKCIINIFNISTIIEGQTIIFPLILYVTAINILKIRSMDTRKLVLIEHFLTFLRILLRLTY